MDSKNVQSMVIRLLEAVDMENDTFVYEEIFQGVINFAINKRRFVELIDAVDSNK